MSKPIVLGNRCTPVVHNRYICGAPDYLITSLELDQDTGTLYIYQNPDNCQQIQIPAILDQQRVAELIEGFAQGLNEAKVDKTYKLNTTNGIQGGGDLTRERTLSIKPNDDHIDVSTDGLRIRQFDTVTTSGTVVSPREIEADSEHFLNALNEWVTIDRESNLAIGERTDSSLEITNSYGTGVTIPSVDNTYAGLATPDMLHYIDTTSKENLVVNIGELKVTNTGFNLGYTTMDRDGVKSNKQIDFPVVTETEAGLITPEMLEQLNDSNSTGIRHIEGVTNSNNYTITSKDVNNNVVDTIIIPTVSEELPGLMTSEQADLISNVNTNRYLKNVTKTQVDDGFQFNYEYYNAGSNQSITESIKIPLAGTEGYPGLITAEEKQRIEDFAFRDAVIEVVGYARPDTYQINVDYRNGRFDMFKIPIVNDELAGLVTSEMYQLWEDLRARVDVVDVTTEQNPNEYDITVHYSNGLTNVRQILESTEDTAGLMSAELTKKLNGVNNNAIVNLQNPDGTHTDIGINYVFDTYKVDTREYDTVTLKVPVATKFEDGLIKSELVDRLDSLNPYVIKFDNPDEPTGVGPFPDYADIFNYYVYDPISKTQYSRRFYLPIADENFPGVITAEMYKELLTTANQSRVLEEFTGKITENGYDISGIRRSGELLNTITVPLVSDTMPGLVIPALVEELHTATKDIDTLEANLKTTNENLATVNNNLVTSITNLNQNMIDGFNTINGGINNEIRPVLDKVVEDLANEIKRSTEEDSRLNQVTITLNNNLVQSINNINQVMIDSFNTINGGIDNEIRPAIKDLEDNVVYWTDYQKPNDDKIRRHILLGNHASLFGQNTKAENVNIAMVSKWDKVDLGSASLPINLNGSEEHPTYNDDIEIVIKPDLDNYVPWTNVNRPSGVPNRSIVLDNDSGLYGTTLEGGPTNLIRLGAYNLIEVGSSNQPLDLNTSETRPTVNTHNYIAYLSDIEDSWSWYEGD